VYEITKVTFNELSDEAINYYIDNYKPSIRLEPMAYRNGLVL
jgi:predicted house-cleaning NTP pyrophosphatase (Maf/HAM1 superfamily)